jgi:hypothetical protein
VSSPWIKESVAALRSALTPASVVDVGSTEVEWAERFRQTGTPDVLRVRPPAHPELPDTALPTLAHDLDLPLVLDRRFDLAVSVGAGERIPATAAPTLVAGLCAAADIVAFAPSPPGSDAPAAPSAATVGLARFRWDTLFEQHGYLPHDAAAPRGWDDDRARLAVRRGLVLYAPPGRLPDAFVAARPMRLAELTGPEPGGGQIDLGNMTRAERQLLESEGRADREHGDAVLLWAALASTQRDLVAASYRPVPSLAESRRDGRTAAMRTITGVLPLRRGFKRALGPGVPLWDESWYLSRYPDVATARVSPLWHYRRHGRLAHRSPHPWFDPGWYAAQNPDVVASGADPVEHYLETGWKEGREPHPAFDTRWYRSQLLRGEEWATSPLEHFLRRGKGLSPHPLIDPTYYRTRNPGISGLQDDPVEHFMRRGWREGREAHPLFDVRWYLEAYLDVAYDGLNPLVHYLAVGWRQGRDPHPMFDTSWYLATYPDVAEAGVEPLSHYLAVGAGEGRAAGPLFDTAWYVAAHPEAVVGGRNPLAYFVDEGIARGDVPSPWSETLDRDLSELVGGSRP